MTTVTDSTPTQQTPGLGALRISKRFVGFVVALVTVLAGLGAWLLIELSNDGVENNATVDLWAEGFLDSDADAIAALFTPNGVYEERGPTQIFQGHLEIRQQLQHAFEYGDATEMNPVDIVVAEKSRKGGNDLIVVEWEMSGVSAPGTRDADDKTPFAVRAVTIFRWKAISSAEATSTRLGASCSTSRPWVRSRD